MSATPTLPEPADARAAALQRQRDEDAQYYRALLHELAEMGADIARTIHRQATTEPAAQPSQESNPAPDPTIAFDRVARTIRRTIALARAISDPTPPHPVSRSPARAAAPVDLSKLTDAELMDGVDRPSPEDRLATHEQITRAVEEAIERECLTDRSEAALLRAELRERLDDPGLDWEIALRPIQAIIADLCRDLGLAAGELAAEFPDFPSWTPPALHDAADPGTGPPG